METYYQLITASHNKEKQQNIWNNKYYKAAYVPLSLWSISCSKVSYQTKNYVAAKKILLLYDIVMPSV